MSSLNVLHEIRENTKSAQTQSQVNVKYISARNGSSGPPTENPFQTTNLSTKAGPIANTAILVIRAMRICRVWLRETHFDVVKKRNHCKGYLFGLEWFEHSTALCSCFSKEQIIYY